MRTMNASEATLEWLRGEHDYQFEKFDLEADSEFFEDGMLAGHWGNQFYSNYPSKIVAAESDGLWLPALQAAGKLAATARAVQVEIREFRSTSPVDSWADNNGKSFELIRAKGQEGSFDYEGVHAIEGTPLDEALRTLDAELPQPFSVDELTEDAEVLADNVLLEGYRYFLHKTEKVAIHVGHLVLPRPGVPSGTIESWRIPGSQD